MRKIENDSQSDPFDQILKRKPQSDFQIRKNGSIKASIEAFRPSTKMIIDNSSGLYRLVWDVSKSAYI